MPMPPDDNPAVEPDSDRRQPLVRIQEKVSMGIPSRLYKYQPYTAQSLENLSRHIWHFGSPTQFNDPYDCALTPNIVPPTDNEVERIRTWYIAMGRVPPGGIDGFAAEPIDSLRAKFVRAVNDTLREAILQFSLTRGVTCFSEVNDNLLMWSHYAGHGKGYCLEFSTASEHFGKTKRVVYSDKMPRFEVGPLLLERDFTTIVESLFCTKSKSWSYEAEWRAIHAEGGTAYCYGPECLTGVYFGPEMGEGARDLVCSILSSKDDHVNYWLGSKSTTEFKLDFQHMTYTPYLEAKRQGLVKPGMPDRESGH